jgi:hypothetical protein
MLKKQIKLLYIVVGLALAGCSSDNSTPENNRPAKSAAPAKNIGSNAIVPEKKAQMQPEKYEPEPKTATRSELRVLAEQARIDEEKAGDYIERFNDNLGNPQARKEVQEQFKKLLPEYKERMLQLGKAKLKQDNP